MQCVYFSETMLTEAVGAPYHRTSHLIVFYQSLADDERLVSVERTKE